MKVAVLGGGNGGVATASHLSLKGFDVSLFELPEFVELPELVESFTSIKKAGGVEIKVAEDTGLFDFPAGFAKISTVTTNIAEAIEDAEIILIIVPSYAQLRFVELCTPHLKQGQVVVLCPGNYGSIDASRLWRRLGVNKDVFVAETNTLPYLCFKSQYLRKDNILRQFVVRPTVWIGYYKRNVSISAFPAKDTKEVLKMMKQLYPDLVLAKNVLEVGLSNPNTVLHPPITLLNAGWIESTRWGFLFYPEGATPSVSRVIEALDKERVAVGEALGFNLVPMKDWLSKEEKTMYEAIKRDRALSTFSSLIKGEINGDLNFMFITEDVPYGLVPMASLADRLHVPTPVTKALIFLACVVNEADYWSQGRTVESLGISQPTMDEMLRLLEEGFT